LTGKGEVGDQGAGDPALLAVGQVARLGYQRAGLSGLFCKEHGSDGPNAEQLPAFRFGEQQGTVKRKGQHMNSE
jgi:hypothetical protein